MKRKTLVLSALTGIMSLSSGILLAADQDRLQAQDRDQDQIYGSQIMTTQERVEFRTKMNSAKTEKEREQIRNEHHARMQEKAKQQGVPLPENPPVRGGSKGPGGGMGPGGGRR